MDQPVRVLCVDRPAVADSLPEASDARPGRLSTEAVSDARSGLRALSTAEFDCVVSGYDLPDTDGIDLLESVREKRPHLPFVLSVDDGSEAVAGEAIRAGVTDYVGTGSPAAAPEALAARIRSAVEEYRTRRATASTAELLSEAVARSPDVLFVFDADWNLEFVNDTYGDVWGDPPEALAADPTSFLEAVHPDDRDPVEAAIERLSAGNASEGEFRIRRSDGTVRWIEARGEPLFEDGHLARIVGFARDVTERKRRERRLGEERNRYRTLSENLPNGAVALFDTDLRYVLVGGTIFDELGLSVSDLEGERFEDAHTESFRRAHREKYLAALDGERREFEFEFEGRHFAARTVPVREEDGTVTGGMALTQDVTERAERERRLERQNERLERFAGILSHDLRNPLQVARGRVELARERRDGEHLVAAARAHRRMDDLIEDLLALARNGREVDRVEPVDAEVVATDCWESVVTDRATIDVETDATLLADRGRLRQLLENLFRNAVEHGSASPRSNSREDAAPYSGDPATTDDRTVRHPPEEDREEAPDDGGVTVTVGRLADDSGIYVADDGVGLPESDIDRLFESGYTTARDGTGFGLAIVEEVAEAHGWSVSAGESDAGGARFEITGVEFAD